MHTVLLITPVTSLPNLSQSGPDILHDVLTFLHTANTCTQVNNIYAHPPCDTQVNASLCFLGTLYFSGKQVKKTRKYLLVFRH